MIQSLKIKNFQSHKDTEFEFHSGINILTGTSAAGKSAVMRSIDWIANNQPDGNMFVSYWNRKKDGSPKEETSVTVTVDGEPVKRIRDDSRNGYDVKGAELGAIGRGTVPDKVKAAMQLEEVSFQRQHEPHFLLSNSSGDVAKYLNTLLKLDSIDTVLAKGNEHKLANSKETTVIDKDLITTQEELDKLHWIERLEELNTEYGVVSTAIIDSETTHSAISAIITDIASCQAVIDSFEKKLPLLPLIESWDQLKTSIDGLEAQLQDINTFVESYEDCEAILQYCELYTPLEPLIAEYDSITSALVPSVNDHSFISRTIEGYTAARGEIITLSDKLDELEAKMPKTCPTCGGAL